MVGPGDDIHLTVSRDGKMRDVTVRSGTRPSELALAGKADPGADAPAPEEGKVLGMRLAANPKGGLMIQGVASDSDAGDKGLRSGDIIVSAGDQKTDSPADLTAAVKAAKNAGRKVGAAAGQARRSPCLHPGRSGRGKGLTPPLV